MASLIALKKKFSFLHFSSTTRSLPLFPLPFICFELFIVPLYSDDLAVILIPKSFQQSDHQPTTFLNQATTLRFRTIAVILLTRLHFTQMGSDRKMPTDPDFLSLVETNRFEQSKTDPTSTKANARLAERKKAFWHEMICLRLASPLSDENDGGLPGAMETWNIPRFRLTEDFLHETVNRSRPSSSPMLLVSHIHCPTSNAVILPSDLQAQSKPSTVYDIVVRCAIQVEKGGVLASSRGDSYYKGDLLFLIKNVPGLSKSEKYEVVTGDIHRWLINGAVTRLETIQIHLTKVQNLRKALQRLEKDIKNIHETQMYNEHGRAITGSPLKEARNAKFKYLQKEQQGVEGLLEKAVQSYEATRAHHFAACSLLVVEHSDKSATGKLSFSVKISGKKKEFYTKLISDKTDWNLVPMYATGDRATRLKSKKKSKEIAVFTTIAEADRAEHWVDVGAASIEILPDGFGVHEAFHAFDPFTTDVRGDSNVTKSYHRVFHGFFQDGQYQKGTLHSDACIFSGTFLSNEPHEGKMKYSDGIVLDGSFLSRQVFQSRTTHSVESLNDEEEESPLGPNPYLRGLPDGNAMRIQFKDGASYEGEMCHGRVSGQGVYRYPSSAPEKQNPHPLSEIQGSYCDGTLQNNSGAEGQGGSNFPRSLYIGGERLWGP